MTTLIAVLNNAGHTISGKGLTLQPGLNEKVPADVFASAFLDERGDPTLGAARFFEKIDGKPEALIIIAPRSIPNLSQDHALMALTSSSVEDLEVLKALVVMEQRKPVAEAIRKRIDELSTKPAAAEPGGTEQRGLIFKGSSSSHVNVIPTPGPDVPIRGEPAIRGGPPESGDHRKPAGPELVEQPISNRPISPPPAPLATSGEGSQSEAHASRPRRGSKE